MQRFEDLARSIHVAAGEAFAIALAGNPTTGYTWQAEVDSSYLEVLAQEFEPGGQAVGAGGQEVFRFCTHQVGETEITFKYQRPWGGEVRDAKCLRVVIG